MQNDHFQGCDCYECQHYSGNHIDVSPVGKFIHSNKNVSLYRSAGGKLVRTVKPKSYIGKVQSVNSKRNWLVTTEGLWVPWSKDLYFAAAKKLSQKQIDEAKEIAFVTVATATQGPLAKPVYNTAKGAIETAEAAADTISFVGKNLKWIIIGLILLGALIAYKVATK